MYLAIHIATKASEPVKQCRMQSKHSDESFSDDQEIVLQSISEAKQKKPLGRKKTTAQFKKVSTKKDKLRFLSYYS